MESALRLPNSISFPFLVSHSICNKSPSSFKTHFPFSPNSLTFSSPSRRTRFSGHPAALPKSSGAGNDENGDEIDWRGNSAVIISACLVGFLTGVGVVLFNTAVHEIRDFSWDGIPSRGTSWLREEPLDSIWFRVVLVPACGGLIVGLLNAAREAVARPDNDLRAALRPFLKTVAACITLGTGNSLGPEGPSVEIGSSIAKVVHKLFDKSPQTRLSLLAAGSAAGISSGFNAAVAGCFFAVESVLWPSPTDSAVSLTNTTSMVILSAVIASVLSEVGLGSEPAFKVPEYDFRSPGELPLYLLLGILCGLVSLALSKCTSFMLGIVDNVQKSVGIPRSVFPVLGGLTVGVMALAYPEILYWGFENVDILLESRPFVEGLSADLLLQLVAIKIMATSLCRASGLVGGYYAPSLFIGAATGMSYGKFISFVFANSTPPVNLSILEVASPQAYGLVGMAATLAGVCQVPLTSVLLLFELTQDYRIVLPLLGAVGFSSLITAGQMKRRDVKEKKALQEGSTSTTKEPQESEVSSSNSSGLSSANVQPEMAAYTSNICDIESSLCLDDFSFTGKDFTKEIFVSEGMRTRYVTILMNTLLADAVTLMLLEKQSCAVIVDDANHLLGLITLADIEEFSKFAKGKNMETKELLVSEVCSLDADKCRVPWTATPSMDLLSVQIIMNRHGISQVPVVSEHVEDCRGRPVGLLDRESISLTLRYVINSPTCFSCIHFLLVH
ncbi:hypothetical protein SLEP1_g9422 [Rubroshorea leprosula]|uniref:Chloride channel protein n=1 Tax=Rubroshorea leprosula TaxID=152421 RepID=A0AAV5IE66_9ROSI|nr:hypothetical protein SLEP1_g9422 [Rubroshorea leprosula]